MKNFVALPALVTLLAFGAAGFPGATYTRCAQGEHNPSGNVFLNDAGFQDGARLTLAQSGTNVALTYVDPNGLTWSLSLAATAPTLATVTEKLQIVPGFRSLCVRGPGNESSYPASLTVMAGALSYDKGTAFLNVTGNLQSSAGECGTLSQPRASFWLVCEDRQGGAVPSVNAKPAGVVQLAAGSYICSTQVETLHAVNGRKQYVAGGGSGRLVLTRDGANLTADYRDDPALSGTLRFIATSSMTASAETGQSLLSPCMSAMSTGGPSRKPQVLSIAAGSLSIIDSTLFLSFTGSMGDNTFCPGARLVGSVICSK
ncbi:MAG: hypothetical protein JO051_08420 [Acidobacteriaceae bacterium]|nr:hypothetical protein [Acidobacteriaceae bacterium]